MSEPVKGMAKEMAAGVLCGLGVCVVYWIDENVRRDL